MSAVLLDTHVLIWIITENSRIGKKSAKLISNAMKEEKLYFSAISMWEIAMLEQRNKIQLIQPIAHWYKDIISLGIQEIPLSGDIAIDSVLLKNLHNDPADRIIAATAIAHGLTLLTADNKLLSWKGTMLKHDVEK